MFLAVIAGYVIAASLAFCGVVNLYAYISEADRGMGYTVFLAGLVVQLWPLAASVCILLLIQLASFAEKIHIYQKMMGLAPADDAPLPPVRPKRKPAAEDEGGFFRTHGSPAPKAEAGWTPPPPPAAAAGAASPGKKAETPAAAGPAPAPKSEKAGLSYFKLD